MHNNERPEYQLNADERYRLHRRYVYLREHQWESFEAFAKWALDTGVWKGAYLRKKDEELPHGPDNSYWSDQPYVGNRSWDRPEIYRSPFCDGCERNTEFGCGGCEKWEEYYVKNWNQNIHVELNLPEPEWDNSGGKFCYEHPDLVREGIV